MAARIIDGVALGKELRERIAARAAAIRPRPRLDAVLVEAGDNSSRIYAENQARTCAALGIDYALHRLPADAPPHDVSAEIDRLNADESVAAIMLHLPLPGGADPYPIQRRIAPEKDVEGVNPANIGNIVYGRSSLAPCTALAVVRMVEWVAAQSGSAQPEGIGALRARRAVVVGAGDVVGKPIAVLLMRQEATVVSCNKWTAEQPGGLAQLTRSADVLIAAAGVPGLITADMVRPGAIVIDVGVNRVPGPDGKLRTVGDADFPSVSQVAGWISPVPGGVGPVTVAMLLLNVVEACERRAAAPAPATPGPHEPRTP